MTLRLRLVLGLVVLVTAGLAVFGFATYELYSPSQYDPLDDQIRASGPADGLAGDTVVVAVPTTEVSAALRRLLFIEGSAGLALLALLAAGAWLLLRRGLRPLESMAHSARSITAGNLSERVSPSERRTEVGQPGVALNTMLGEPESAFAERDRLGDRLRRVL